MLQVMPDVIPTITNDAASIANQVKVCCFEVLITAPVQNSEFN